MPPDTVFRGWKEDGSSKMDAAAHRPARSMTGGPSTGPPARIVSPALDAVNSYWVFGSLRGWRIGVPNLFGFFGPRPQRVGESNALPAWITHRSPELVRVLRAAPPTSWGVQHAACVDNASESRTCSGSSGRAPNKLGSPTRCPPNELGSPTRCPQLVGESTSGGR